MKYVMCRHIMLEDQGKDEYDVPRGRKAYFKVLGESSTRGNWEIMSDATDDRVSLRADGGNWAFEPRPGEPEGDLYLYTGNGTRLLHLSAVTRDFLEGADCSFTWTGIGMHWRTTTTLWYSFYIPCI
jgi:hypothetical protein